MANINYVRFQRGTQKAYELLKTAGTLDRNTLYFIENEDGTNALYMGLKVVCGGNNIITPTSLKDLEDIIINDTGANSFLVKDNSTDKWISKSFEDIIALIEQELNIDTTINIADLQNQIVNIKENIDDLEQSIIQKIDTETFNTELNKKANIDDINIELNKKIDIDTFNTELNKKANIDDINAELNKKIDNETFYETLSTKANIEDVNNALNLKANINEVYTKIEIDKKITSDIDAAIVATNHLKRLKVNSIYDIDMDLPNADQYIYMIPTGLQEDDNKYDEYMVIDGTIEKVGSWEVDLTEYAKKSDLDSKVNVDNNARLITLNEVEKLLNIEPNAQVNIINSVSNDFSIDIENNRQLVLKTLSLDKINNLQNILNNKVDAQQGYTLLSPDDQKKLSALVIGEDNDLQLSGSVNADKVQGLAEWLKNNSSKVKGLSENNITDELYNKINSGLLITSINTNQLQINDGELSIIAIDSSKVNGLQDLLNEKANQSIVSDLSIQINDITKSLNNYVDKITYEQDIAEIKDILTWKEMS